MDLSGVQHVDSPTRDVLVIFDNDGDREFIGFGSAEADQFADCFISAEKLPAKKIQVRAAASHTLSSSPPCCLKQAFLYCNGQDFTEHKRSGNVQCRQQSSW